MPEICELTWDGQHADFIPRIHPLEDSFLQRAVSDEDYASRTQPLLERLAELQGFRTYVTPSSSSSSISSISSTSSNSSISTALSSQTDFPSSLALSAAPETQPKLAATALKEVEREEHYDWLSGLLGPAMGIQENVGTYRSYMECQRRVYLERLLDVDGRKCAPCSPVTNEFKGWVSRPVPNQSPLQNVPFRSVGQPQVDADQVPVSSDSLDSLFPRLDMEQRTPLSPNNPDYLSDCSRPSTSLAVREVGVQIEDAIRGPKQTAQAHCRRESHISAGRHIRFDTNSDASCIRKFQTEVIRIVRRRTFSSGGEL